MEPENNDMYKQRILESLTYYIDGLSRYIEASRVLETVGGVDNPEQHVKKLTRIVKDCWDTKTFVEDNL